MPSNSLQFWDKINQSNLPNDFLSGVRYAVFGLGDSSYVYFNKAAKDIDDRIQDLGGQRLVGCGLGDDKDDERYETAWYDWSPNLFNEVGLKAPKGVLFPATFTVLPSEEPGEQYIPSGFYTLPMT